MCQTIRLNKATPISLPCLHHIIESNKSDKGLLDDVVYCQTATVVDAMVGITNKKE